MRITLNTQTNETLLTLNDQQEQINSLSQQISSGVRLSSASDDPYSWARAMNVKQGLREYNSFVNNINFATGWDQATESALNQLSDLVSQAKQVAISAASGNSTSESAALSTEVNGILNQAVNMANSQYGDQYIFGGTSTTTSPYSIDASGNVTYNGDQNYIQVKTSTSSVSDGGSTVVNLTGDEVFSYSSGANSLNVLHEIWDLGNAIKTGDSAKIGDKLTTLNDAFTHINNELTTIGCKLSDLSTKQSAITAFTTTETGTLSNLQDTDVAAATTKLTQVQTAFEAALKVTASLSGLNLASYLSSTG
ncbi:MAG: flagellar hook-associated protein FlgL [Syntrophobacteraceae bacterium]|jgi:flagellar hook-associated protein 3 FlgL